MGLLCFSISCWLCQEGIALTALYLGYFSGFYLQQAILRDELVLSSMTKSRHTYYCLQNAQCPSVVI